MNKGYVLFIFISPVIPPVQEALDMYFLNERVNELLSE